jgi:hypothetical protein
MSNKIAIAKKTFGLPGLSAYSYAVHPAEAPGLETQSLVEGLIRSISSSDYPERIKVRIERAIAEAVESGNSTEDILSLQRAADFAFRLAMNLPYDFPFPEISYDADFDIVFEWEVRPKRWFSVSIDANGVANFASISGTTEQHGRFPVADHIPQSVFKLIAESARLP